MIVPEQTWRRRYNLSDWWKSAIFVAALAAIELYAAVVPEAHG